MFFLAIVRLWAMFYSTKQELSYLCNDFTEEVEPVNQCHLLLFDPAR